MKKLILSFSFLFLCATVSFAQSDPTADSWTDSGDDVTVDKKIVATRAGLSTVILNNTNGQAVSLNAGATGSTFRVTKIGGFKVQGLDKSEILAGGVSGIVKIFEIDGNAPIDAFNIDANGNVGIGIAQADITQKLTINGMMLAEEAKIITDVTAPDYVFASDYNLRSLEEVENFINKNSHLPEIPSAAEFAKDGIMVGQMSFDLLKKVEELTLYMIEMKKENKLLKQRIEELEKK